MIWTAFMYAQNGDVHVTSIGAVSLEQDLAVTVPGELFAEIAAVSLVATAREDLVSEISSTLEVEYG